MKTLDQLIAEAVKSGGLAQLTLYRTAKGWQGNAKRRSGGSDGWLCMTDADPVRALSAALCGEVSTEVVQTVKAVEDQDIFG